MIVFVITDTAKSYRNDGWFKVSRILEDIADDTCLIVHYKKTSLKFLAELRPWAICHSGAAADYKEYDVLSDQNYKKAVRRCNIPQIGFCGGHQIIASFFGSTLGSMRRLKYDEPDIGADYKPGMFKEWGVYPVRVIKSDPLFSACGKIIRVPEYHYWAVKKLGRDLALLASSQNCRVQAFRHRYKLIYGTQFHPEEFSKAYPAGAKILKNFFWIARKRHLKEWRNS